jgi:hypothetical protein
MLTTPPPKKKALIAFKGLNIVSPSSFNCVNYLEFLFVQAEKQFLLLTKMYGICIIMTIYLQVNQIKITYSQPT